MNRERLLASHKKAESRFETWTWPVLGSVIQKLYQEDCTSWLE
jgi:hypothetical protein